jgi:segregation and condensation protein A
LSDTGLDYKVRLEVFEGPLDLLLYLIKKEEVDIKDIPIARITEQYLSYLDLMRDLNLDVAGEFILMAATLAHIKSRELLPKDPTVVADEEEEGDPRAELVRRLLEYQKYKAVADELGDKPILNRDTFQRGEANVAGAKERNADLDTAPPDAPLEVSLFALLDAFRRVMERMPPKTFHEVAGDTVSVAEKAKELATTLSKRGKITFTELFLSTQPQRKIDIIATFLALLEMVRMKLLAIGQVDGFGEISIESRIPEGLDVVSVLNGTDLEKAFAYSSGVKAAALPEPAPVVIVETGTASADPSPTSETESE